MLVIKDLNKTFNTGTVNEKKAIDNVSLTINDGDFITVIGGNGAGKSTLLNLISGTYMSDSGSIVLNDQDITKLKEYKRASMIGRVFQDPMTGTCKELTIEENFSLALRRGQNRTLKKGITSKEKDDYKNLIKDLDLGLEDRMTSKVGLLSGGQRQRLAIARALVQKTEIILFDEATSALDNETQRQIQKSIDNISSLSFMFG